MFSFYLAYDAAIRFDQLSWKLSRARGKSPSPTFQWSYMIHHVTYYSSKQARRTTKNRARGITQRSQPLQKDVNLWYTAVRAGERFYWIQRSLSPLSVKYQSSSTLTSVPDETLAPHLRHMNSLVMIARSWGRLLLAGSWAGLNLVHERRLHSAEIAT